MHLMARADTTVDVEPSTNEPTVDEILAIADRLCALADTAELMGDDDGAARFRSAAADRHRVAMQRLDG